MGNLSLLLLIISGIKTIFTKYDRRRDIPGGTSTHIQTVCFGTSGKKGKHVQTYAYAFSFNDLCIYLFVNLCREWHQLAARNLKPKTKIRSKCSFASVHLFKPMPNQSSVVLFIQTQK